MDGRMNSLSPKFISIFKGHSLKCSISLSIFIIVVGLIYNFLCIIISYSKI
jgi:hypothetical protein